MSPNVSYLIVRARCLHGDSIYLSYCLSPTCLAVSTGCSRDGYRRTVGIVLGQGSSNSGVLGDDVLCVGNIEPGSSDVQ